MIREKPKTKKVTSISAIYELADIVAARIKHETHRSHVPDGHPKESLLASKNSEIIIERKEVK